MVNLVVVTHGEFGAYLVEAAEGIVGPQSGVASVGISSRFSVDEVRSKIQETIRNNRGKDGLVVVTDMPGGTPCNVVMPIAKDLEDVHIVSGVNLYMLVTAFNIRRTSTAAEVSEKMREAAARSVKDIKAMFVTRT